jgi:quinol monooxygenase YgiN
MNFKPEKLRIIEKMHIFKFEEQNFPQMIVVQFQFLVPEEKIQEFLEYANNTLKKTWEALGCKSYSVYRDSNERIRGDQVIEKNRITEQLFFDSIEDVKRFFDKKNLTQEQLEIADSYRKRFNVTDMHSIILEKIC